MTNPLREDDRKNLQEVTSPGKRLRIARQAKGMSHSEVASHLHLSSAIVQALENDDHDRLPGPVFVRGYLRNYARLLGLDDSAVVNDSERQGADDDKTPAAVYTGVRPEIRSGHFAVRLVSWLIAISLLVLLALWWQDRLGWESSEPEINEAAPTPSAVDEDGSLRLPDPDAAPAQLPGIEPESTAQGLAASNDSPAEPIMAPVTQTLPSMSENTEPALVDTPTENAKQNSAAEKLPDDTATTEAAPPAPAAAMAAVSSPPETDTPEAATGVTFEFTGPCWVDIRDSTRKFKIFGEMRKGDTRVLEGTPPYSVILGNAPTVKITINGKPYDVQAHARGSVARFTLDPNGIAQN